jgi:hypothetical protein
MTAHHSGGREKDLPSASAGVSRIAVSVTESESYRQPRTIMKKSLSSAPVGPVTWNDARYSVESTLRR